MGQVENNRDFQPGSEARIVASPTVVLREEFDHWAVLFDPDTGAALGVNPVGAAVWRLLDGTRTLDQVLQKIRASFSEVPPFAMADLSSYAQQLHSAGLVRLATADD